MSGTAPRTLDENGLVIGAADAIYTFSGRIIRPLDPNPDDIALEDIAHALSNQCRFTGHTRNFYSVAEHCILATALVARDQRLETLLHDASEAYLADIARPVKKAPGFAETYLKYEAQLEAAIQQRFGLPVGPMPDYVKTADERMLGIEIHTLLPSNFAKAYGPIEPWFISGPRCWSPRRAEDRFLELFDEVCS